MPHVLDYRPDDGTLLLAADAYAAPPPRAPMTPVSTQVSKYPPVLSQRASWVSLIQLVHTFPGLVMTPAAQGYADQLAAAHMAAAWDGPLEGVTLPDGFTAYPWQLQAAVQYPRVRRGMLNDDPGTGKTYSAVLGVLAAQAADGWPSGVVVVCCPLGVVTSWAEAWAQLGDVQARPVRVTRYLGPTRSKRLAGVGQDGLDVLVTTYDVMRRDVAALIKLEPLHVVADEHHLLKTPGSARSKAFRALASASSGVIVLSGTPITHHPGDLWAPLASMWPSGFPSQARYVGRYLEVVQGDYGDEVLGFLPHRRAEFDTVLAGVQRRVSKADALPWLPDKVYTVREVDMPKEYRKAYNDMRDEFVAELPDSPTESLNAFSVLAQLQHLQALAAAPCDVEVTMHTDDNGMEVASYHTHMLEGSWKVAELLAVLEERPDEQVAVFSPSRQLIELAGKALEAEGITVRYIVGGQTPKARDAARDDFQAGKARVVLVTTSAGGVGITLTAARCAVFLSRPWGLVEATQSEDRVHRIGSERHSSIDIVDIVTKDTVDARVRDILVTRADALGDMLHDPRVALSVLGGR